MATAGNTDRVIVWEYEGDFQNMFIPYTDVISNFIEDEYKKNPTITNNRLPSSDPVLKDKIINFQTMKQDSAYGSTRRIRRKIYEHDTAVGKGVIWQWQTDRGWYSYDIEAIEAIEKAYGNRKKELDLEFLSFALPNVVIFKHLIQRNKHSGYTRQIQRVDVKYKQTNEQIKDNDMVKNTQECNSSDKNTDRTDCGLSKDCARFCDIIENGNKAEATKAGDESDVCPICLCPYSEENEPPVTIVSLKKCKHQLHLPCMDGYVKAQNGKLDFLQCPLCKAINGTKVGDQPDGSMSVIVDKRRHIPGYPKCGMVTITYNFSSGVQDERHPSPGRRYYANSFPRTAYLPDSTEGRKVLKLLQIAFDRKLTFTIGQSVTTGQSDSVVWNEIHHKTSAFDNYSGHGYPDPNYLSNVLMELKQHGVTEDDLTTT